MKLRTGLLIATILVMQHAASGKSSTFVSITSVQRRRANSDKPFSIRAKTSESAPKTYYKLVCENRAVHLEVGHRYVEARGAETLLLFLNGDTPTLSGLE